jgi:hypothetical protein
MSIFENLTIQKLYFIAEILIFVLSLEMDVVYFSKTSVNFYQTTRCFIPQDSVP